MSHFIAQQKLTQHCRAIILQKTKPNQTKPNQCAFFYVGISECLFEVLWPNLHKCVSGPVEVATIAVCLSTVRACVDTA